MFIANQAGQGQRQFQPCFGILGLIEQIEQQINRLFILQVAKGGGIGHLQPFIAFTWQAFT